MSDETRRSGGGRGSGGPRGLRVVVIVSPDISDIYFANRLIKELNVVGVFVERQESYPTDALSRLTRGLRYLKSPSAFAGRLKEELYGKGLRKRAEAINLAGFGEEGLDIKREALNGELIYTEGCNDINNEAYIKKLRALAPDVVAVCGASILRKPILDVAPMGTLNLHGGLSQWYRGVWTTLWAVYNEEPQYVGATVHYVSSGIDDGRIIHQGRPIIEAADDHESLYVKVVKLGTGLMIRSIKEIEAGTVKGRSLRKKGRLYLKKNLTPDVLRDVWRKVDGGLIRRYVERGGVDTGVKIVD